MDEAAVIDRTRRWVSGVVIGLNLCPFARRVFDGGLIRYVVTPAAGPAELAEVLIAELRALANMPASAVETTLLIHPNALADFLDYNDFLADADDIVRELGLEGTIQLAGFHPNYRFTGTAPDAAENYTNRSPFPMIHLLREESVSRAVDGPVDVRDIPRRNIATLNRLGRDGLEALLARIEREPPPR